MTQRNGSKAADPLATTPGAAAADARMYPSRLTTVARATRLAFALALAACGGRPHGDTYQHATATEQSCCEQLAGGARDQCLASLVHVDDPAVATSSTNQQTFACVEDHFVCDASTGRATTRSAQAQLDCIADLDQ
jgi:hypothetical protein